MAETLGARLRRHREDQSIALVTIAEHTKIKLSLLEALEEDDVSHWPSGIYRRAYLRAYAKAINLDPDTLVREFVELHPEPADVAAAAAIAAAIENGSDNGRGHRRFRSIVDSAIGSLGLRRPKPVEAPPVTADLVIGLAAAIGRDEKGGQAAPPAPADDPLDDPFFDLADTLANPEPASAPEPAGERVTALPPTRRIFPEPDFTSVAQLCTEFCRVENASQLQRLLQQASAMLNAAGIIVWVWDAGSEELRPALTHGYSYRVRAQFPAVRRDDDNATAKAFRSAHICAINGSEGGSGALAVPLCTPGECAGVLAIEMQPGCEMTSAIRASATIFAAMLAQLIGEARPAAAPRDEERASLKADAGAGVAAGPAVH